MSDALQSVLTQAGLAIAPMRAIKTPEQAVAFFRKLGYEIPTGAFGPGLSALATQAEGLITEVQKLAQASDAGAIASAVGDLFTKLIGTIAAVRQLHSEIQAGGGGALPNIADLPRRLTDFLVLDFLDRQKPDTHRTLHLLGLIEDEPKPSPGQPTRLINWDRFGAFLSGPKQIANDVYHWETDFDITIFLARLASVMRASSLPGGVYPQTAASQTAIGNSTAGLPELRFPIFQKGIAPGTYAQFGITFSPVEAKGPAKKGFALLPYLMGATAFSFDVCDRGQLKFDSSADIRGIGIVIRPPLDAEGLLNLTGAFSASVTIAEKPDKAEEMVLIGTAGGTRLSIQGLGVKWFAGNTQGKFDLGMQAMIQSLRLVLKGGDGDGFIQKILSGVDVNAQASLAFGMSLLTGFTLQAGASLEVDLDVHISAGPVEIDGLQLSLEPANDHFNLGVGAVLKCSLGPLQASVEGIGIQGLLKFQHGNLGPADLGIQFLSPKGVGLSLDAGVIKGGGFLAIDSARGEYDGALQLVFADFLGLQAIGIITTKLPDGSRGFSLLIIITADFGAGIQLGFGFTLLAVGGLIGLNRSMLMQPLMDGIRNDAIDSIMFPKDVIGNAPRIISDLRAIFPPQEGTFLIGPMAKLGWGEPTLISLAMAVIIEIPPGNVAILGVLKMALPADEIPILVLQVNFAGVLEFDKDRLYFFATLYDSHILFLTIDGDMGVLVAWGPGSSFVVSVGGFHPQFNPPPLPFPLPRRIEVDIINESFARIRCDGYFALTSNTLQFGSHSEYFFGFDALNLNGHSSFDALIQFSPFHFNVHISTSFSVDVFGIGVYGIDIDLTLEGPTPWHAHGTASLSFFFFSVDIGIDFTWGDSRNTALPPVAVMPIAFGEFQKQSNWKAVLPAGSNLLVALRKMDTTESAMVLHPVGTLQISQRTVPMDMTLDKFGNQQPSDANNFAVDSSGGGLSKTGILQEQFAPAQFTNMDDAAKLSQPAYVPMDSGIALAADGHAYASGTAITRRIRYELTVIDTKLLRKVSKFFNFTGSLFLHFLAGSSVARCPLSAFQKNLAQPYAQKVSVSPETFVVAQQSNNTAFHPDATGFTSQAAAHDYMLQQIAKNPSLAGTLHVLPQFEVAA